MDLSLSCSCAAHLIGPNTSTHCDGSTLTVYRADGTISRTSTDISHCYRKDSPINRHCMPLIHSTLHAAKGIIFYKQAGRSSAIIDTRKH